MPNREMPSLKDEEKHIVATVVGDLHLDNANRKGLAADIQKKLDEAYPHRDRTSSIEKLLLVLNRFVSVGDVAVSFDPVHAALPWAALRSVLVILTAKHELNGIILAGMAEVTWLLVRCDTYQQLYMSPDPTLRPPETVLRDLRSFIVQVYAESQSFLAFMIRRPQSKIMIDAAFKLEPTRNHVESRSGLRDLCELVAEFPVIQQKVELILERMNARDEREILDWISPIPYGKHHISVKEARTPGTFLWLQGSIGTGKTFITSKAIDHTLNGLKSQWDHVGFAYFYCNRNEDSRKDPLCVLQSYVRQLSTAVGAPGYMRKSLQVASEEARRRASHFGVEECKTQLLESISGYSQTILILDALDECDPISRCKLIEAICDLVSKSDRPIKVFISSRPDSDIKHALRSWPYIEVLAMDNERDIERFAYLQIEQILELPTEADIRNKLGKLPLGLKDAYDEIYEKATKSPHAKILVDRACKWVMSSFKPFTSSELLSAISVDSAHVITDFENKTDELGLQALFSNLLVLDSERRVWRFTHLSVVEYFEVNHWGLREAHSNAAKVCFRLLIDMYDSPVYEMSMKGLGDRPKAEAQNATEQIGPFQKYVVQHWVINVRTYEEQIAKEEQEGDVSLIDLLKCFFGSPFESSVQYRAWYRRLDARESIDSSLLRGIDKEEISPEEVTICVMCRFSLFILLRDWWNNIGTTVTQTNGWGDSLLTMAAAAGSKSICEILTKHGVKINLLSPCGRYGSALAAAAFLGRTEIVKFLVGKGAEPNLILSGGVLGSALVAASVLGRIEIVQFLVEKGAEPNLELPTGIYGSALAAAASRGHVEVVQFLVENFIVCWEIVQFLVEKGAEPNLELSIWNYESALAAAASEGHVEVVQFLVEKGAKPNFRLPNGNYGSALAVASSGGYYRDVVKILLQKRFHVSIGDDERPLPIGNFAFNGDNHLVGVSLQTIRVASNPPEPMGRTPLHLAAVSGQSQIVELLLTHGASPGAKDHYGSTAIFAAVANGHEDVVQCLLGFQDAIDFEDLFGRSLFWWAKKKSGSINIVRLLLEYSQKNGILISKADLDLECDLVPRGGNGVVRRVYSGYFRRELGYICAACVDFDVCVECYEVGGRCLYHPDELAFKEPRG
ncbi:uncharacterized protein N7484_002822 [Penicillium longicatenatum]|uniref:uncharacterized protein n=1 Tax=Penicillium longicatenatum TaxID=1561947 RepID=UPI00254879D0|nr:uncharacterized protein N7484_002822 [Penicillium longicatenatum]KAJ5649099.1 hypothetical protein N7484_002822 [Penicillium longicatenatum]